MKRRFEYGQYLESVQDAEQIKHNLEAFVPFFIDCQKVLDLGCGNGQFLRMLQDAGVEAIGVDGDALAARQAEDAGMKVVKSDVVEFLRTSSDTFDGIFCSHLVEHLASDVLVDLFEGISRVSNPGGVVVIAFPNPESLEMQLFHFWVDPQHVRFYHPTLIEAMLHHYGFEVIETRLRNWRTGGTWSSRNTVEGGNGFADHPGMARKFGRRVKTFLGISRLEDEVDYLTRLKNIGEEAVIVARKS